MPERSPRRPNETPAAGSVDCRRCGTPVAWREDEPLPESFPFCSRRCRLIDLGRWFDEDFRMTRAIEEDDLGA